MLEKNSDKMMKTTIHLSDRREDYDDDEDNVNDKQPYPAAASNAPSPALSGRQRIK